METFFYKINVASHETRYSAKLLTYIFPTPTCLSRRKSPKREKVQRSAFVLFFSKERQDAFFLLNHYLKFCLGVIEKHPIFLIHIEDPNLSSYDISLYLLDEHKVMLGKKN